MAKARRAGFQPPTKHAVRRRREVDWRRTPLENDVPFAFNPVKRREKSIINHTSLAHHSSFTASFSTTNPDPNPGAASPPFENRGGQYFYAPKQSKLKAAPGAAASPEQSKLKGAAPQAAAPPEQSQTFTDSTHAYRRDVSLTAELPKQRRVAQPSRLTRPRGPELGRRPPLKEGPDGGHGLTLGGPDGTALDAPADPPVGSEAAVAQRPAGQGGSGSVC